MRLRFLYDIYIRLSEPVYDHYYSIKFMPRDTDRQCVIQTEVQIQPENPLQRDTDSFGNESVYGLIREPHSSFRAKIQGVVETGLAVNEHHDTRHLDLFKTQTVQTVPGKGIEDFYRDIVVQAPDEAYERVLYFMEQLYNHMNYVGGSTDITTTAEEAMEKGCGVCQDYAHIFLSILRMEGIPARYVVGMMVGEGQSHAWIEYNLKGYWYGLDPTNNSLVDENYIKISHGRDYKDCLVSKGVFKNALAIQNQTINVLVEKI